MQTIEKAHQIGIKENDFVLIHGATGGVGLSALEISKAMGAKVIATAGTDEKLKIEAPKKGKEATKQEYKAIISGKMIEMRNNRGRRRSN